MGFQPFRVLLEEAYLHHVFLSPSVTASDGDTEGGAPVSIIEMAASGMPIVTTRHCDIPAVVIDGVTGLLADERDVDGLVQRLGWLVDNRDRWRPMLDAGRMHVEEHFDAVKQGESLAGIYRQVSN
jgi:colanic acid/amylovoran biosynthesis glycosyltransferase